MTCKQIKEKSEVRLDPFIPNIKGFMPGVDIQGDAAYVVAPPSKHSSGELYLTITSLDDVVEALEEMERVCKRDGFILFDIRNKINPFVYLSFKFVRIYDTDVTLNAYSLKELTTVLTSKGLVIKETIPIGFPITVPVEPIFVANTAAMINGMGSISK